MRKVKKVAQCVVTLVLVLLLLSSTSVFAVEFEDQGFSYKRITGGAEIIGFSDNSHLLNATSISIPVNLAGKVVLEIAKYAFMDNTTLEEVVFQGSSLTSIGGFAFYGNTALKSLSIPKNIKAIGSSAFYNCSSLQTVTFGGNGLTMVSSYTFANCPSLTEIVIPGTVTKIDEYAFSNDTALKNIYIPKNVNTIFSNSFKNCSELTIYGVSNSYAQTFAEENGFPFVAQNKINKHPLTAAIAQAKKLLDGSTEVYTDQSIAELRNQYQYALDVDQATFYTQEDVDLALSKLEAALTNLQLKTQKDKLEQLLNTAKEILDNHTDKYTEDSFVVLQSAYEDGQVVFLDNNAAQTAIDSAVEKLEWGIENLIEVEPEIMLGDINNDKTVDMRDVLVMQRGYARYFSFTEWERKVADVTKDGEVDMHDILKVSRYIARLIPSLD